MAEETFSGRDFKVGPPYPWFRFTIRDVLWLTMVSLICWSLLLWCQNGVAASEVDEATKDFLKECVANSKAAIVVGLLDGKGSAVFGAGTLDNATDQPVDRDTVFFIGSVTKTFTAVAAVRDGKSR